MAIRSPTSASERELVLESQVKDLEELLEGHPGKGELYRQRNNFMEELRLNRQRVTELELAVSKKDKQLESLASELGVALDEQQRLRYQLDCAQLTLMEMQKDDPVDQKEEPQRSGPSTTSLGHSQATTNVTSFEERAKELEIWEKALKKKHSELDLRLTELQFLVQRRPALLKDLDVLFKEVVVLMKLTKEAQVAGHVREQCQRIDDIARHLLSTSLTNFEKRYLGLNVSVFPGPEAASTEKKLPYSPLKGPNTSAMRSTVPSSVARSLSPRNQNFQLSSAVRTWSPQRSSGRFSPSSVRTASPDRRGSSPVSAPRLQQLSATPTDAGSTGLATAGNRHTSPPQQQPAPIRGSSPARSLQSTGSAPTKPISVTVSVTKPTTVSGNRFGSPGKQQSISITSTPPRGFRSPMRSSSASKSSRKSPPHTSLEPNLFPGGFTSPIYSAPPAEGGFRAPRQFSPHRKNPHPEPLRFQSP
eukprot:TRINITY_DN20928_c0_g1_i1.p1 TRINITY_DN20928_c0_g1~~TRINITY_DN20928_c0_g1_i1.p1  ORF type:complete len:475 (-),score=80.84 TRINITY_DN20928_c0_g1_i1:42-1466(-)